MLSFELSPCKNPLKIQLKLVRTSITDPDYPLAEMSLFYEENKVRDVVITPHHF